MLPILARRARARAGRAAVWLAGTTVAAGLLSAVPNAVPAWAAPAPAPAAAVTDPASYVNPFIGTGNGGARVGSVNEYPGPDAPLGMIQWGPDTGPTVDPVGYYYDDTAIKGFSLTRLGGVGCNIFGDFRFLPTAQAVTASPGTGSGWNTYTSAFSHSNESAKASYYSVTTVNGIQTQLTAATRAAMGQFTYPAGSPATMLINASSSVGNEGSTLQITSPDTITGSATGGGFCGHTTQRYTVYFAVTFDHPFSSYGTWQGGTATPASASVTGKSTGGWVSFDTSTSPVVKAKVAISYVSVDGARANMASAPSDFPAMQAQTYAAWNSLLSKIGVSGGAADEETTFYTALYHALLDPSVFSDADGQYMGFDFKVHTVPAGHTAYANFSGWDIYRSEVPLLAMLEPEEASDMMQSLVNDAEQGGWLPKWPTANTYTGMMGGDSADPMIADAYAFGARDFDLKTALQYMLKGADDTASPWGQGVYSPRESYINQPGWGDYLQQGYVPTGPDGSAFGTSLTEEFSLDDFTIGQFAAAVGDQSTAADFQRRSQNWQNIFDPGTGYVVPRGPNAPADRDPATQTDGFEEGDASQYTWMVPQNLAGLFTALGGDKAAASRLDTYFTQLNAGSTSPYHWQGNETTLESPWEYDYLGQPWKTQNVVRQITTQLYGPTPGGEPGNDDLGAMSSWYVWAALGMYPETSGTGTLALGSPLFPFAVIHLANGKDITINAPGAGASAPYVQDVQLNGQDWPKNYLSPGQYSHGATLDYTLGTTPDTTRGTGPQDAPPSYTAGEAPAIGFTSPPGGVTPNRTGTASPSAAQVSMQSEVTRPVTVRWTATAPSGITVTPSSGELTIPPGGQASAPVTVSAESSVAGGTYDVGIAFTDAKGEWFPSTSLAVSAPGPLSAFFDNVGITDNSDPNPATNWSLFDGGGTTYSAQGLAADGLTPGATVSIAGLNFTWPNVAPAEPDNVMAQGQTITISGSGSSLGFLAASNNAVESGTGTIYYTDGTTQSFTLDVGNFWNPSGSNGNPGNVVAAGVDYANETTGPTTHEVYVFEQSVPLAAGKTVEAVTLPSLGNVAGYNPALHIFAMAIG